MICELVTVAVLQTAHARPVSARRVCLAALIRRARREGAIVVDLRNGRVIVPAPRRVRPVLSVAELLGVVR